MNQLPTHLMHLREAHNRSRVIVRTLAVVCGVATAAWAVPATARAGRTLAVGAPKPIVVTDVALRQLTPTPGGATIRLARPTGQEGVMHTLELELGKSVFLRTEFRVKRVSVGNPEILDVVVLGPSELQLVPKRSGGTNVVLWDKSGEPQAAIDVSVGTEHSQIERLLRRTLGTDDIHVESAGDSVVLHGTVFSPVDVERAIAVAQAFFPQQPKKRVVNLINVGGNQQVMIEVIISEMSRTLTRDLTVNWSTIIEAGATVLTFETFIGKLVSLGGDLSTADEFLLSDRVNLLGSVVKPGSFAINTFFEFANLNGLAKILAQPTLLARSGQTASFLVGGEVPIPVAQGGAFGSITIEFKDFGVGMSFTPTVLGPDRILLEVSPEVSDVDFTLGTRIGDIVTPGFRTRRVSTAVELGDGQSFAIAGLLRDDILETVEKYPVLGDIPILGALFRSVNFRKNETELVMIVTPHLVKPLPPGPHPLPTDSFIEPSEFEFFLQGALESQSGTGHGVKDQERPKGATGPLIGPAGHRLPATIEEEKE